VPVPVQEQTQLSQPPLTVNVGEIWWLPEDLAGYPGGKDRFCLIVALEIAVGSPLPARAHYVAGSTSPGGPPEIVLEAGEANLRWRTYFRFWWSGDIDIPSLVAVGRLKGQLDPARVSEIRTTIGASKRIVLKKLVGC